MGINVGETLMGLVTTSGIYQYLTNPLALIMVAIACVLLYLAIVKQFEPLLLLPIAFGMLLTNLLGSDIFHEELFAGGHANWALFGGAVLIDGKDFVDSVGYMVNAAGQILTSNNVVLGHFVNAVTIDDPTKLVPFADILAQFAANGNAASIILEDAFLKNIGAANTDLVFGVISEQFGLILALCTVFILLVLVLYATRCAATARSSYYVIAANSAAAMLVFQATLNVLGAVDILPLTGVTLPFVSVGGSSMISCWGLLAFLKAADTRPNASFTLKLPKRIRGWIPPDADRMYDDRYNGWYDDYDEDAYEDYGYDDGYEDYDEYEDYDDYDQFAEDWTQDRGGWEDLIDGPLWPEGEDPLADPPPACGRSDERRRRR